MSYDRLGAAYDQDSHVEVARGFYKAVSALLPGLRDRELLDLGCGTGLLTAHLAARGFRVLGVDRSRRMLEVARARCRRYGPRVRFALGDLRSFGVDRPAAAAFACADIVNHFPTANSLAAFFRNTRRLLAPGGIFVFDALNRWCFETYWRDRTYVFHGRHGDIVMECDWNARERLGRAKMTIYEKLKGDTYRRRGFTLRERLYDERTLKDLLVRAGYSRVTFRAWSPWTDQHLEPSLDRTLWVATR